MNGPFGFGLVEPEADSLEVLRDDYLKRRGLGLQAPGYARRLENAYIRALEELAPANWWVLGTIKSLVRERREAPNGQWFAYLERLLAVFQNRSSAARGK